MSQQDICITNCYGEKHSLNLILFHPFLATYHINNPVDNSYCVKKDFSEDIIKKCTRNDKVIISIEDAFSNPINPKDFLKYYYNLNSLNEVILYIKNNNLINLSKNRLLDFAYITYGTTIKSHIDDWIELIRIIFTDYDLDNNKIIKIINAIENKINPIEKYPLNLLSKIKKYLDK